MLGLPQKVFSLSGNLAKLYADEITLHGNSNIVFGYKRLDGQVLLAVTKWRILGFTESEVVRWSEYQHLKSEEMARVMEEEGFISGARATLPVALAHKS